MIEARDLQFARQGRRLLAGVDLTLEPGTFTAIAGPNGAGKTSLLKVISGEAKAFGSLKINGKDINDFSVADLSKVRAVLPQSSHLQFPFTVEQVVRLGHKLNGGFNSQSNATIEEVMELTGITRWASKNFLALSGGEQQRVHLARVLAQVWERRGYPRYILLDEPTSSMDIAQQQLTFSLVKQACTRHIGVMAIVHDLNQVVQFADRLCFLRDGQILANGNAKDVFTKPIIEATFCCRVNVYHDPCTNCPYIVPDQVSNLSPLKKIQL